MWIGMSRRGGGEQGQTGGMGWEAERVGIDRGSGVGESGDRRSGVGGGECGDIQVEWGGRGREWGRRGREWG